MCVWRAYRTGGTKIGFFFLVFLQQENTTAMPPIKKKVVIVGDGESGKTCLLRVFFEDIFPEVYVPTVFDNYSTTIQVDGKTVELDLWDTAGQDDYDRLRPLSYGNADVIIVCYSIDTAKSLINVIDKWVPEVRYFCNDVPVVLVGNKKDLRDGVVAHDLPRPAGVDQEVVIAAAAAVAENDTVVTYRHILSHIYRPRANDDGSQSQVVLFTSPIERERESGLNIGCNRRPVAPYFGS